MRSARNRQALTGPTLVVALILKRASAFRSSGEWNDDDYEVLADGVVVGRIFKGHAATGGLPLAALGRVKWNGGIIAALIGAGMLLVRLYRISLSEGREITSYTLLILLDEKATEAKNAQDLYINIALATGRVPAKLAHTNLGVAGLLWKLKNSPVQP